MYLDMYSHMCFCKHCSNHYSKYFCNLIDRFLYKFQRSLLSNLSLQEFLRMEHLP